MISSWDHGGAGSTSLWAVLVSVIVVTAVVSTISAVCGVLVCKRRRTSSHNPVPHWSTHVTVTPTITNPNNNNNNNNNNNSLSNGAKLNGHGDRMTLMAYSDQEHGVILPSYEEALREGVTPGASGGTRRNPEHGHTTYRHHAQGHRSSRHHPVQAEVVQTNGHKYQVSGVRSGGRRSAAGTERRHQESGDSISITGCAHSRQQSGSNNGSLR